MSSLVKAKNAVLPAFGEYRLRDAFELTIDSVEGCVIAQSNSDPSVRILVVNLDEAENLPVADAMEIVKARLAWIKRRYVQQMENTAAQ